MRKDSSERDQCLSRPKQFWSACEPCRPPCSLRFWSKSSRRCRSAPNKGSVPSRKNLAWARKHFSAVLALDGSTLDALSKKIGLLQGMPGTVLAGRMAALLDVTSLLPRKIWYEEDSKAHDQTFWKGALAQVEPGMLLLFDLSFVDYEQFDRMSQAGIFFVTRLKTPMETPLASPTPTRTRRPRPSTSRTVRSL